MAAGGDVRLPCVGRRTVAAERPHCSRDDEVNEQRARKTRAVTRTVSEMGVRWKRGIRDATPPIGRGHRGAGYRTVANVCGVL